MSIRKLLLILLCILCARTYACIPQVTHNYYIFYLTPDAGDSDQLKLREEHDMALAWGQYLHRHVTDDEARSLADVRPGDIDASNHPIIAYARQHQDYEMMTYLALLTRYFAATPDRDAWDYPTEAELLAQASELRAIERLASQYRGKRLQDRYLLLSMRCLFKAKDYKACIRLWNHRPRSLANPDVPSHGGQGNVFLRMASGYYAGALYRTGLYEEAAARFAARGDVQSARWCMRDGRSLSCIKSIFEQNPRAAVLPFVLQDFVNNAQETYDCYRKINSNPDYYGMDIKLLMAHEPVMDKEAADFVHFATRAAQEVRTQSAMWYSAAAMICYLRGEYKVAKDLAEQGCQGLGTAVMKDNARAVRLLVSTTDVRTDELKQFESSITPELLWLHAKSEAETTSLGRWERCRQRIVHHGLIPLYAAMDNDFMTFLWQSYSDYPTKTDERQHFNVSYSSGFCQNLDTIPVDRLKMFYDYCYSNTLERSVLMRWLLKQTYHEPEWFSDFIGTRLLRAGRFEEAQACFYNVSTAFLSRQAIAPYMVHRHYTYALWQIRQPIPESLLYAPADVHVNAKRQFCQDVLNIRSNYAKAKGKERVHWAYNLAVLYSQASLNGQCWWLTHYAKSVDSRMRDGDFDYQGEAYRLLGEVLDKTTDADYRQAALMGRCLLSPDSWISYDPYDVSQSPVLYRNSRQWQDYAQLANYALNNAVGTQISRCSELKRFIKMR